MNKETDKKERLKRISFYGHKPEGILRALMKVDPKRIREQEEEERRQKDLEKKADRT